jgi:hypothetical protein
MTPRQTPCRHAASWPPASGARYPALRAPPSAGCGTGNAGHLRRGGSCVVIRWPCAENSEDRPPAPRSGIQWPVGRQRSVPADGQASDRRPNRRSAAGGCRGPTASYGTLCVRRCPSLDAPEPPICAGPGAQPWPRTGRPEQGVIAVSAANSGIFPLLSGWRATGLLRGTVWCRGAGNQGRPPGAREFPGRGPLPAGLGQSSVPAAVLYRWTIL